ncbi:cellulose binding domain-containing protein, partial [Microbispora triticiradicis]|uniref:cellulose-binding domain-containing protein n=1 Tax=Microbispora triticiradicis TaxID=2200763 RepID=UPI00296E9425
MPPIRHRRWLAAAMAAALGALGVTTAGTAQAAAGCEVTYTVTSSWPGGFGADVKVSNLGDPINGWKLTWTFTAGQTITQLWNGTHTQSGAQVTVSDAGYNASIPTGGSTSFGFNGGLSGSANPVPTNFAVNGTACTGTVTSSPSPSPSPSPSASPSQSPSQSPSPSPSPSASPSASPSPSPSPSATPSGPWPPSSTYSNPVLWDDLADIDIIRVGDTYYYSASTMHYSPGAP